MPMTLAGGALGQSAMGRAPLASAPVPLLLIRQVITSSSGSLIVPEDCMADIFAFGSGGGGASVSGFGNGGGGGGAAGYSRLLVPARSALSWIAGSGGTSVGSPGNDVAGINGADTTVSLNGALIGTAQGGRGGVTSGAAARSFATGFQVNRYGGGAGEAGEFGGTSGSSSGGGSGGFNDMFGAVAPGNGGNPTSSIPISAPTAGGGGAGVSQRYSGYGGSGLVVVNLYQLP